MNTDKLISLKQNFTGQKFQWIKPDRPELLAKVVKCRDVDVMHDGRFIVIFDDGSKIDSTKLNSNLLMLHGDMSPLTREEVESIYGTKPKTPTNPPISPGIAQSNPALTNMVNSAQPIETRPTQSQPVAASRPNMFAMFNAEESTLTLNLKVRVPERRLLKMMYLKAEDKEKFVSELAEHLHMMINKQVVKDSVQAILLPPPPKKEKATINLTEVDGSN